MNFCIFCNIVSRKKPAYIIYEDEFTMAFLAKEAVAEGHILVITKTHRPTVFDLEDEETAQLMHATKSMAELLREKLQAEGVNLLHASGLAAQQSVPHFHTHVVPRYANDGLDLWFGKITTERDARNERIYNKLMD